MKDVDLEIIYEDQDILVCYKPAGIATQTKRLGQQDMESLLRNYRAKKRETPYIGVVHRLDQPVEGVMVFAKTPKAAASLSKQVRERNIGKHYLALVGGARKESKLAKQGTLVDYLYSDARQNLSRVVTPQEMTENERLQRDAKKAMLEYKCLTKDEEGALYEVLLHTGRHHQIRLQFANAGSPLQGDAKYGDNPNQQQLGLCSYRIEFCHPRDGKRLDFSIKPSHPAMRRFLDKDGDLSYIEG